MLDANSLFIVVKITNNREERFIVGYFVVYQVFLQEECDVCAQYIRYSVIICD